jgi:hypothetical protein
MSNEEWLHLAQHAYAECRTPKEQARYLLRAALGLTGDGGDAMPQNTKNDVSDRQVIANVALP